MQARPQFADTLAEVACNASVYQSAGNEVAKTSERLHFACHYTAAAAVHKMQLRYCHCAYACKAAVSLDCATADMSADKRNIFAAHRET